MICKNQIGISLIEVMITVAIACVIIVAGIKFFQVSMPYYRRTQVRQTLAMDSRRCFESIQQKLRNGKGPSLRVSTPEPSASNPTPAPRSRADFVFVSALPSGATAYAIFQENDKIYTQEFPGNINNRQLLTNNVAWLTFDNPNSADRSIVKIKLHMQAPYDTSNNPTHVSEVILPDQTVNMAESL